MTHVADLCVIMKSNYGEKPLFLLKKITTRSDSIICEHVYTNMLNFILFGGVFTMFCFHKNIIGGTSNSCIRILYTVALLIFAGIELKSHFQRYKISWSMNISIQCVIRICTSIIIYIRENWYPVNFDKTQRTPTPTVFSHFSEFGQFNHVHFYSCISNTFQDILDN